MPETETLKASAASPSEPQRSNDALLSTEELASLMGVSRLTLYRYRSAGGGPPFVRLSACRVGYPVGAYRRWVSQQMAESSCAPA